MSFFYAFRKIYFVEKSSKIADELKDIDKCIYLDGDTLIKKSLEDLYDLDLGDNYVAAVPDETVLVVPIFVPPL